MKKLTILAGALILCALISCEKSEELSLEDFEALHPAGLDELLAKTVSKPWEGQEFVKGKIGGTWNSSVTNEPKSFNLLVAERDAETAAIVGRMQDTLMEYDAVRREWKPRCASYEILVDEAAGTLDVIYTLRDDLYWSYYNSSTKIPVTSDDAIFWYDGISGDPAFHSSTYNSQFIIMQDESEAHIDIRKIDNKRFAFHFPRIVADPMLSTNMDFGPAHIYKKAKDEKGVQGVLDLFSIAADPKTIPSMGEWFLTEYISGQRLVYKRNPDYWNRDSAGVSIPYMEELIVQILPDQNTQFLVFKEGRLEAYSSRPEDLDELINKSGTHRSIMDRIMAIFKKAGKENTDYTVFNAAGSVGAQMWSFNQNPQNSDTAQYEWFTQKTFRQAMSCLLNRDRIIAQVYRGLADPKIDFFPEPNPYYNEDIKLEYLYNPNRAIELLSSIGIKQDKDGVMRDSKKRQIEFDLSIPSDITITSDIASIIMDECARVGIKVNIRPVDFQKLVDQLSTTYDWASVIIGLGSNFFPTQGSNVWPSDGNLHLWHPLQESPGTDWEARIDYLYNEGKYTIDREKAKLLWDEYQKLILEQCPVIYLLRPRSFYALRNRWDFSNVYYDNISGAKTSHIFLKAD
ncbi:peptide-binding protein [Spirochaetia bacterium]|nr:peptide-binding protein [Spirochaetia bacterium]